MKKLLGSMALACTLALTSTAYVVAGDTACGQGDILSALAPIEESVIVIDNGSLTGTCIINIPVAGNVKVESGASVDVRAMIGGNLQADESKTVIVRRTTVKGDVQVKKATGTTHVFRSMVGGNVQLEENSGVSAISSSTIMGDAELVKNKRIVVNGNTVGGNLMCKENSGPLSGIGNTVGGNMEEQCSTF